MHSNDITPLTEVDLIWWTLKYADSYGISWTGLRINFGSHLTKKNMNLWQTLNFHDLIRATNIYIDLDEA